ncbi:MAG: PASTA domain-containing protein [Bacteroidota bacterium]
MLRYFISREFFLTLLGLILGGVLLYMAIFFWILPAYTRHGDGILVPDVGEIPYTEAVQLLEREGLRPAEKPDSIYVDNLPPGVVIKQYPVPYSRVKPKRTIALTINKFEPPMVQMPEVVDHTLYQAKVRLENWSLGIGRVMQRPDFAKNAVLEVRYKGNSIKPGTKIPRGSKVDLIVGSGKKEGYVEIPDLTYYTFEDAISIISSLQLGLGSVVYNPSGPADQIGKVYDQKPQYQLGDSILMGSSIDLYIYGEEPKSNEGVFKEEVNGDDDP